MKGIIMGADSVRAILEGRKTRHSFPIKPQPPEGVTWVGWMLDSTARENTKHIGSACWTEGSHYFYAKPRYKVGEIVYVKEVFAYWKDESQCIAYQADNNHFDFTNRIGWEDEINIEDISKKGKWESPYFMPEWASRIHLEITGIKAQRVQDITEEEAINEGIEKDLDGWKDHTKRFANHPEYPAFGGMFRDILPTAINSYKKLWDSINGKKHPWESNPWVFVYTFKVVEGKV